MRDRQRERQRKNKQSSKERNKCDVKAGDRLIIIVLLCSKIVFCSFEKSGGNMVYKIKGRKELEYRENQGHQCS